MKNMAENGAKHGPRLVPKKGGERITKKWAGHAIHARMLRIRQSPILSGYGINMPDAARMAGAQPGESMISHAKDDDLMRAVRDVYKNAKASLDFKERLHRRLAMELAPELVWHQSSSSGGSLRWIPVNKGIEGQVFKVHP